MTILVAFLIWLLASTICVLILACLLALFHVKPPPPRRDGWFGPYP